MILNHRARLLLGTAGFAGALVVGGASEGQGQDGYIAVRATVTAECNFDGPNEFTLSFGEYDSNLGLEESLDIFITCSDEVNLDVKLNSGEFLDTTRRMKSQFDHFLSYDLYKDPGFSDLFGDGSYGTPQNITVQPPTAKLVTVYGRVPTLQPVAAGSYNDTVQITFVVL